jgi:predicted AlkP superfamily pyrophosphatase or phosphodiesterase
MNRTLKNFTFSVALIFTLTSNLFSQNVFIVVIDGARYSETFGAEEKYIPHIWNKLLSEGTIYTNFRNEGYTNTIPGHSSIVSGVWEYLPNDGCEPPKHPTIFECYRKQKSIPEEKVWVVAGADKLESIAYSTAEGYGEDFCASVETNDYTGDEDTYENLIEIIEDKRPSLVLVNLREVDIVGHDGEWEEYLAAIRLADSLIYNFWNFIQKDDYYKNKTTMFVTNDHGRHDDEHGGFRHHGCDCEGCTHLMLFAIGPGFEIGGLVTEKKTQLNLAPTIADILNFEMSLTDSSSLLK